MKQKLEAVLFDMDGVLLDSEEFICRAGVEMFREKGYTVAPEDFRQFTGMGENRYLGGVAKLYGIPFELEKDKARTYEIYERIVKGELSLFPGAREFIDKCLSRDLKIALASSADRIKIDINLRETALPPDTFHTIVSGLDIKNKKPSPDIFLKAANDLGVEPSRCLVIEDAVSGIEAGKAAGCRVLALTTSFPAEKLAGADWVIPDLSGADDSLVSW